MSELKYQLMLNKDMSWVPCYLKSEADKVIARHKYKRCLAMAMWCSAELGMLVSTWEFKIKHYKKWQRRWLKLPSRRKTHPRIFETLPGATKKHDRQDKK